MKHRDKKIKPKIDPPFRRPARPLSSLDTQRIVCGDHLDQLPKLPGECIDLVYIDPPFNSNRVYETFWGETKEKRSFEDRHESTRTYIDYMHPRCIELARVLKKTGSFYYHCDWHASHYVKMMLDQIFGENRFENEIIWRRTTAHTDTHGFGHVHDILFRYSCGSAPVFNVERRPYSQAYMDKYFVFEDEFVVTRGLHWRDNLTGSGLRNGETGKIWRGIDPATIGKGRHWMTTPAKLEELVAEGRIFFAPEGGVPKLKRYAKEAKGVPVDSIWDDIPSLGGLSAASQESVGFPTQKPVALLERIIKASSNTDDIVLDAFCGCGTALVAAEKLDRRWIGIDSSPTACRVMSERLRKVCKLQEGRDFLVCDLPRNEEELRRMPPFEFQNWAVIALGGIPNRKKSGDKGVDGRFYPVASESKKNVRDSDEFDFMKWYPVQVKQRDKAGRPDIDAFETAIQREDKQKGIFVSFDYSSEALEEIRGFFNRSGRVIVPLTVRQLMDVDATDLAMKLA